MKSILALLLLAIWGGQAVGQVQQTEQKNSEPVTDVLNQQQWERVDTSVERALTWLAKDQNKDGSFTTYRTGQPGVTALCLMAYTDPVYHDRVSDRYHYGAVVCSQAMFQLGGKFWKQFFPPLVDTLLANQKADGSWPRDRSDRRYGNCYSTSLSILSLTVPNQMLPIFQR